MSTHPQGGQPNMGHRHSLTIETNPLHLLPSNIRRFSVADHNSRPGSSILTKLSINNAHLQETKEKDEKMDESSTNNEGAKK